MEPFRKLIPTSAPLLFFALAWPDLSAHLPAQSLSPEHDRVRYRAVRVEAGPVVDGDLSDPVWEAAQVIDQLIQQEPNFGQPASEKTLVRVLYDAEALYLGVYCYESPIGAVRNLLRFRDDNVWRNDDTIRFVLDTFHDHRRTYVFASNALGTKQDAQIDNEVWHTDWDEVWEVRTRLQEDGWSAEFRIPFRILRFSTDGDGVWGFNVERLIKKSNERSYWAPIPPGVPLARPASYGHLEGLADIRPKRNLQFVPYGLFGGTWPPTGDPELARDAGLDVKLAVTSALTLDVTYNTNFAQVEADDQQINLTRFSLFFPEKREFFLENAQLFAFGIPREAQLFFSRRIGLSGNEEVPILGGVRLSGRAGPFDLGLLTTQTEGHLGIPSTNFSAARLRWNVGPRSYIGGIFTSVASDDQENRAFGPDYTFWLGRYLRWEGFAAMVKDSAIATNPLAFTTAVIYDQDLWEVNLRSLRVDREFRPALGFIQRQGGFGRQQAKLRRGWRLNRPWARKLDLSAQFTYLENASGVLDTRQWLLEVSNQLDSGDTLRASFQQNFERVAADEPPFVVHPRRGIAIPPGDYPFRRWLLAYTGFPGRAFVGEIQLEAGQFYSGDRAALTTSTTWRASPHLLLSADYQYNKLSLPQANFGTHLWRGRFSVPVNARTTLDAFLQWNSLLQELNTQFRFHLIYAEDSNVFLVFTDQRRDLGAGIIERDRALQMKLTYRWYW